MNRTSVVPKLRELAENNPIKQAMYALAAIGPGFWEERPRMHDAEWRLMKELGGHKWREDGQ
jgi:hypothetical protein